MLLDRIPSTAWALACACLVAAAAYERSEASDAHAKLAGLGEQIATATRMAEADARAKEAALRDQADDLRNQLTTELQNAKATQNRLVADIRAGALRLSIPARCPPAGQASADPATAAGSGPESPRAELDPEASEALVSITKDGDTAIRERNACVALYDRTRATLNSAPTALTD